MNLRKEYSDAKGIESTIKKYPKRIFPKPTAEDYRIGYIERYFAKSISNKNGSIIEISKEEYEKLTGLFPSPISFYYNAIKLRWKIKGTSEEIQRSNSSIVLLQEKYMPGIILYLGNLLQFWQG